MRILRIVPLAAALLSAGCATEMAWQRSDGRPIDRSFHWATAKCRERAQHFDGRATEVMQRCMGHYGYVWTSVPSYNGYNGDNGYNGYNGHDDDDD